MTEETATRRRRGPPNFRGALVRIDTTRFVREPEIDEEPQEVLAVTRSPFVNKLIASLRLSELREIALWRGASIELYASAVLTFVSSCSVLTAVQSGIDFPPTAIAIVNGMLLILLIYATARPSGGHINPLITMATAAVGLTSPMRALLYVPAQMVGSALGSAAFRSGLGLWGEKVTVQHMAGCVIPEGMKLSQAFCIEFFACFAVFIVGFGCALDPVVGQVYGPIYAPVLIGVVVGMIIWCTSALVPGYTGAGINPARCFGPTLVANDGWEEFWLVFFLAPMAASCAHIPIYLWAPPDHVEKKSKTQGKTSESSSPREASFPEL